MQSPKRVVMSTDSKFWTPQFLVAMPELQDPNFSKAVVYLTHYSSEGALGYVLNHPANLSLSENIVLPEGQLSPAYQNFPVYSGGPVEPERLWILFRESAYMTDHRTVLAPDISLSQDIDILLDDSRTLTTSQMKIFHGYAGWGAGQLDQEFKASSWILTPADTTLLFSHPTEKLWETVLAKMGISPQSLVSVPHTHLN